MNLLKFIDFYWTCPLDLKPLKIREQHLTECFRWRQSNLTCTVQFRHRGPPVLIGQECSMSGTEGQMHSQTTRPGHTIFGRHPQADVSFYLSFYLLFSFPFLGLGWAKPQSFQGKGQWAKCLESKPSSINNVYLWRKTNNSLFSGLFFLLTVVKCSNSCSRVFFFFFLPPWSVIWTLCNHTRGWKPILFSEAPCLWK